MKNYILIGIIGVLIVGGYFVFQIILKNPAPEIHQENITQSDEYDGVEGANQSEVLEVEIRADSPYTLPDGETKIILEKGGSLNGITGRPKVTVRNETLAIIPRTVIANRGYIFNISTPYDCKTQSKIQGDVGVTIIESCMFRITAEKESPPMIRLNELSGIFDYDVQAPMWYYSKRSPIQIVAGTDDHFVSLSVTDADRYKTTASENILVDLSLDVITSFGTKSIFLKHGSEEEITIGPEKIKVKMLSVEKTNKTMIYGGMMDSVRLDIGVEPIANQSEAVIFDYRE